MSTLPASAGTQKLWMTSAAVQAEDDASSGGQMQLVGEDDLAPVLRIAQAQLPPPVVADDADDQRPAGRDAADVARQCE